MKFRSPFNVGAVDTHTLQDILAMLFSCHESWSPPIDRMISFICRLGGVLDNVLLFGLFRNFVCAISPKQGLTNVHHY